jgi:hydrogenase expression/formation protein HypD
MKRLDTAQGRRLAEHWVREITRITTRPWRIMEICGGQTQAIVKFGIDQLLPPEIELLHGPGCPVCVTPLEMVDRALAIAARPDTIFCSFGDMLRVPGSKSDLLQLKAQGADVRVLYSPLDALTIARKNPGKSVVFFAIGFETTAPANALAIHQAHERGLSNFSALVSHVLTPPAITAILQDPAHRVQAFLGPGHRLRAARSAGRRLARSAAAGGGRAGRRKPIQPRGERPGQPCIAVIARARVRGVRQKMARHWASPKERAPPALRIPSTRRPARVRGR